MYESGLIVGSGRAGRLTRRGVDDGDGVPLPGARGVLEGTGRSGGRGGLESKRLGGGCAVGAAVMVSRIGAVSRTGRVDMHLKGRLLGGGA